MRAAHGHPRPAGLGGRAGPRRTAAAPLAGVAARGSPPAGGLRAAPLRALGSAVKVLFLARAAGLSGSLVRPGLRGAAGLRRGPGARPCPSPPVPPVGAGPPGPPSGAALRALASAAASAGPCASARGRLGRGLGAAPVEQPPRPARKGLRVRRCRPSPSPSVLRRWSCWRRVPRRCVRLPAQGAGAGRTRRAKRYLLPRPPLPLRLGLGPRPSGFVLVSGLVPSLPCFGGPSSGPAAPSPGT